MENYINNFYSYTDCIVYNFEIGFGGIGDCIRYFIYILENCMKNNQRLYYKKNNIEIENYLKLIYDFMYIDDLSSRNYTIVGPQQYYDYSHLLNSNIKISDVFYFSNEIIENSKIIFPTNITNYISIHLRLGDKFLEIPNKYKYVQDDTRCFNEENINKKIEKYKNDAIFFCCDNNSFRNKIKERYNNIIITTGEIGHTSFTNTSKKQVLDTITELYLLTKSQKIYSASQSGFSIIASLFNHIPFERI